MIHEADPAPSEICFAAVVTICKKIVVSLSLFLSLFPRHCYLVSYVVWCHVTRGIILFNVTKLVCIHMYVVYLVDPPLPPSKGALHQLGSIVATPTQVFTGNFFCFVFASTNFRNSPLLLLINIFIIRKKDQFNYFIIIFFFSNKKLK